ncbi:lipoprotein [Chryseotalea sanaruensis]|jgi:PBP1b-binding outer membrane lipoprotein LpoB|nr:lipoprotein [Chryseotalea sanaruensis]
MKKLVVVIVAVIFLASCSQYTCPTYSKAPAPKKVENKI